MPKPTDDLGRTVDATFSIETTHRGLSLVFESRGGGASPRNTEYNTGLRLILERLGRAHVAVTDAFLETRETTHLSPEHRRLRLDGARYPLDLWQHTDFDSLQLQLGRAQARAGRQPGARGGNRTRRIRLELLPPLPVTASTLEALLTQSGPAPVAAEPPRRPSRGQGFGSSPEQRRALEAHAMHVATQWLEGRGYSVEDTSSTHPYDLVATQGQTVVFVEVKGTTSDGRQVMVTRNEVKHALAHPELCMLFIVHDIHFAEGVSPPVAAGGSLRLIHPWSPAESDLTPINYQYLVPDLGPSP